ncbi:MAG: O-antigen ligase family protein [Clostridiales bacterium]|nr:O-antigen ligase family protein [Clostridiales bacterium]
MNKNKKEVNGTDIAVSLILGFIIVIVPLIVRLAVVKISGDEYGTVRSSTASNDVFIYCKSRALIVAVVVLLIVLGLDLLTDFGKKKIYFKHPFIIAGGAYGVFALLSTLFSSYKHTALSGVTERYEGVLVLLCYIALFMVMFHFVKNVKKLNFFMGCLMLSAFLVGLVGIGQFLGFDIFKTDFVTKLIYGSYYNEGNTLSVKYENIYSTLYNPNCVGSFFALMLPVFLLPALLLPLKNRLKYGCIVLTVVCVINVVGSGSAGSLLGLGSSAVVIVLTGLFYCIKKGTFKKISPVGAGITVIAAAVILVFGVAVVKTDSFSFQKVQVIFDVLSGKTVQESPYFYRDFYIDGDKGVIKTAYFDVEVSKADGEPLLTVDGEELSYTGVSEENGVITYSYNVPYLERSCVMFADDVIYFEGFDGLTTVDFMFRETENGLTGVVRNGESYDLDTEVEHMGFEGLEYLGSSRGYIWSRSLPLVFKLKNFILGSGPDTFVLEFPQTDLVGKTRFLGNPYVIVDKPHNMYLQIAINTGAFSLIAFIALAVIYFVSTVKAMLKSSSKYLNIIRLGLLWGVLAYLASAVSTDSNVCVAPLYWIILGLGCSLNKIDFSEDREETEQ